eukprot:2121719-Pyramimonas_sp.AAC.1
MVANQSAQGPNAAGAAAAGSGHGGFVPQREVAAAGAGPRRGRSRRAHVPSEGVKTPCLDLAPWTSSSS